MSERANQAEADRAVRDAVLLERSRSLAVLKNVHQALVDAALAAEGATVVLTRKAAYVENWLPSDSGRPPYDWIILPDGTRVRGDEQSVKQVVEDCKKYIADLELQNEELRSQVQRSIYWLRDEWGNNSYKMQRCCARATEILSAVLRKTEPER